MYQVYEDLYNLLKPEVPDKHLILYSYEASLLHKSGLIDSNTLLAMYKYIIVNNVKEKYQKELKQLTHIIKNTYSEDIASIFISYSM